MGSRAFFLVLCPHRLAKLGDVTGLFRTLRHLIISATNLLNECNSFVLIYRTSPLVSLEVRGVVCCIVVF